MSKHATWGRSGHRSATASMTRISAGRCSGAKGTSARSSARSSASTRAGADRIDAPVHDAMPHGFGQRLAAALEIAEERSHRRRVIAHGRSDPLHAPARDFAFAARVHLEEGVLQRRRAAVDRQDAHGQGRRGRSPGRIMAAWRQSAPRNRAAGPTGAWIGYPPAPSPCTSKSPTSSTSRSMLSSSPSSPPPSSTSSGPRCRSSASASRPSRERSRSLKRRRARARVALPGQRPHPRSSRARYVTREMCAWDEQSVYEMSQHRGALDHHAQREARVAQVLLRVRHVRDRGRSAAAARGASCAGDSSCACAWCARWPSASSSARSRRRSRPRQRRCGTWPRSI